MDANRFTQMLADCFSEIVPDYFRVEARDGMLWFSVDPEPPPGHLKGYAWGPSGTWVRDNFGRHGETDEENIVGAAVQALDNLQDFVSEATSDPWPGTGRQPGPHGRIEDHRLLLWYGDDRVVLRCPPIDLRGLSEGG